jgi:hypothetical protein
MDALSPNSALDERVAPAVVVSVQAKVGTDRNMNMQFAVPLDMTVKDLNAYMDKITSVMERQNDKGLLEYSKALLAGAEKQLLENIEQRAHFESKCRLDFAISGRRGEFKPTDSQRAQFNNWDTSASNLRDNILPKYKKDIEELERKINEGV